MQAARQTEYAAIEARTYYGPSTSYKLLALGSREEAEQAMEDNRPEDGIRRLEHNQSGEHERLCVVEREIDVDDWSVWPEDMIQAACEIAREDGIDPEDPDRLMESDRDWPAEAAEAAGRILVPDDGRGAISARWLLLKPID